MPFFFFQAEDGIRDKLVTGVQTCALPISRCAIRTRSRREAESGSPPRALPSNTEIGRASCRERVEILVVAGWLKKKDKSKRTIQEVTREYDMQHDHRKCVATVAETIAYCG